MKTSLIPLVAILAGCDPAPPQQPEVERQRQPNPVFETQIQAMEKARTVENQLMEAAEAQRRQLDETTQQ